MKETEKDALIDELVWILKKCRYIIARDLGGLQVDFIEQALKNAKQITGKAGN